MIHILQTISGIWEYTGGPAESVPMLCMELARNGNKVTLATLKGPLSEATRNCQAKGVELLTYPYIKGQFSPAFAKAIPELCKKHEVIHGHGLWLHVNWVTGSSARRFNKPLVISPRGSLIPQRLAHSYWKKKIAEFFFDKQNLKYASCLHATSIQEYESIRDHGLNNPVAIIPNGVKMQVLDKHILKQELIHKYPKLKDKKIILYLSRISWEKGLPLLAEAWANVSADFKNWHLLIGGQGPQKYENEIKKLFSEKGLSERVTWAGLLLGEEKLSALALAELFVLPTLSENFGIAIAEALSTGIPVITTQGAPWPDLIEWECGWWIPIDASHLANALREALALPDSVRQEMGEKGKRLIQSKYTWEEVASQMTAVYDWIIRKDKPPHCVKID